MEYYLKRLQEAPLESFASSFVVEVPENDAAPKEQKYHVLGNSKEDEELRKSLHAKRLVSIFVHFLLIMHTLTKFRNSPRKPSP